MSVRELVKLNWAANLRVGPRFRKPALLLLDVGALFLAVCLAILTTQQGRVALQPWFGLGTVLAAVLLAKLVVFVLLGVYRISLSHLGLKDAIEVFKAVSLGSLLFGSISLLLWSLGAEAVAPPVIISDYLFTLMFVGGLRAIRRVHSEVLFRRPVARIRRVLIAGAGSAGELTLRAIFHGKNQECLPVGMVDDDPAKQGMTIHGVPVLGRCREIPRLTQAWGVQELLIAMPSAPPYVVREIAQLGRKAGLKRIKVLPALNQLISGKLAVSDLRDLQLEDLLGREPVQIETEEIRSYLKDKVVLVTGGAGSIGSELCRQIAAFHPQHLVVLDQDETGLFQLRQELNRQSPLPELSVVVGDIQDEGRMRHVFSSFQPRVVFHSAAYKHVGMMEENPGEAVRNNVLGTRILGEAACLYGAEKFVLISTDKAVNPTCIMGATKRLAEMVVQSLNGQNSCRFVAVRFGNVLGSRGSVVQIFREQIQRRAPITVTHPEMRRYFMTPREAALLVLQAGSIGSGGEIFVLDMGDPVAILDLAREMIQLAGMEPGRDIPIVFTHPYPGEKLFEDILTAEEGTTATKHRRIYVARANSVARSGNLNGNLDRLLTLVNQDNRQGIIEAICELLPNYCPAGRDFDSPLGTKKLMASGHSVPYPS